MDKVLQRIRIAESCNQTPIKRETRKGKESPDGVVLKYKMCEGGGWYSWEPVPDYPNDLNAMHKAVSRMDEGSKARYSGILHDIVDAEIWGSITVIEATAAQRAEAYLKAIEKWKESDS